MLAVQYKLHADKTHLRHNFFETNAKNALEEKLKKIYGRSVYNLQQISQALLRLEKMY